MEREAGGGRSAGALHRAQDEAVAVFGAFQHFEAYVSLDVHEGESAGQSTVMAAFDEQRGRAVEEAGGFRYAGLAPVAVVQQ